MVKLLVLRMIKTAPQHFLKGIFAERHFDVGEELDKCEYFVQE